MSPILFLLQAATPSPVATAPEKLPAWLTIIYMAGLLLVVVVLIISLIRSWHRPTAKANNPNELSREVRARLGSTSTNRGLRALRVIFVVLTIAVFGFH